MNLEFKENKNDLRFEKEHNLNTKPLAVDLLVIKKEPYVRISNEIGTFLRGHNIIEYKSPEDNLDIGVFYKPIAYASLYKAYGNFVDKQKADDMIVSIYPEIQATETVSLFKGAWIFPDNPGKRHLLYRRKHCLPDTDYCYFPQKKLKNISKKEY